ncbi:Rdx family protein [Halocatena halophila]|uniref:Rdx family protein n=1 Tax=Halocatena halophila TaxID=2814576 RepID=UPI002ED34780
MTLVEIEYCVPCGFLERAESIQHALLENFGQQLEGVLLQTGEHGVLQVRIEDTVVYDKQEDTYDVDEIVRAVRNEL